MSGMGDGNVCDRLYEIAGVRPSRNWMNNYRASTGGGGQRQDTDSADAILQQILYQDLRDVVREDVASSQPVNSNSREWRLLVRSLQPGSNDLGGSSMKATLPESFRLMIQVEELVDVSQNSESRLSGGGGGPQRCLKLCTSDGYFFDNGNSSTSSSNSDVNDDDNSGEQALYAVELSPIPNLSLKSKAGIKILLHGPIDIRWGVLLLDEGNALVLGGHVQHLAELQAKALESAKRKSGIGIDPTIRALVWNPLTGDEQDEDEGEQESGDVSAATPPPPPPPMGPQAPTMPIFNPAAVPTRPTQANQSMPAQQQRQPQAQHQQQHQLSRRQPLMVSPTPTTINTTITRPGQRSSPTTLPRQQHQQHQQHNSLNANRANLGQPSAATIIPPAPTRPQGASINPYARTASAPPRVVAASSSINGGTTTTNRTSQNTMSSSAQSTASSTSSSVRLPPSISTAINSQQSTKMTTPQTRTAVMLDNRLPEVQDVIMTDASNITTATTTCTTAIDSNGSNKGTTNQETFLSFGELHDLLTRARQNETLYSEQFGKVFVVSAMKQIETHHYFQIEKLKKKKTKDKKHAYSIHARFAGTSSEAGKITCAIANNIIEPFFGLSATELRNTSRSQKERAQTLTSEGGGRLKEACTKLARWQVTLNLTADEYFRSSADPSPSLDGKTPVLMLLDRKES